ncbi:MAG TPA: N-acetylmuramoyl-L-alanine amidase-like domain-containing protein [Ignavibacteriaceae bacterium]|nr:N-acetylmuramoyl-L-alanine amidase-like domain-containing protein [Ignavibacteriaceae bacterium]
MINYFKPFLVVLLLTCNVFAQVYSDTDVTVCRSKFSYAASAGLADEPITDVMADIGKTFLGTDYLSHGIEDNGDEQLVINLTGLDCTTFVENTLVFARLIKMGKASFKDYENELQKIRYRGGNIDQYPSRLHYFTDWIYDNEQKGIIDDVTELVGGKPVQFHLNFMSTHPESYPQLKNHPEFIKEIRKQEAEIGRRSYFYVPKERIGFVENQINNGDIIAFTTSIPGLDVSHVGIAVRMEDNRIHILHAPHVGSVVQITEEPLSAYINKIKKDTGIMVLKPLDPTQKNLTDY